MSEMASLCSKMVTVMVQQHTYMDKITVHHNLYKYYEPRIKTLKMAKVIAKI